MEQHVSLDEIGEYAVHHEIARFLNQQIGDDIVGDDAAVLAIGSSKSSVLLASTDRLAAGVPAGLRAKLLVAQTLSDVICMGGTPAGLLLAVQWPRSSTLGECMSFIAEVEQEASRYGCHVVGGDTKEGPSFAAVGTVMALADEQRIVKRRPVREKDVVIVTSAKGKKWGARWANQLATQYDVQLAGDLRSRLAASDLEIELPLAETQALMEQGILRAGLDLSDGIGAGLQILAEANDIGFNILPTALDELVDPLAAAVADALGILPRSMILSPGYMWENMYAIDRSSVTAAL